MLFSSITFIYVFLPLVMIIYYLIPSFMKNYFLLASSLIFYAWGEPRFVIIMILEIIVGYILGLLIGKFREKSCAKLLLAASLFLNIGILGIFKYADFVISGINTIAKTDISLLKIALPIGISFYTFQIISYLIDVYRGEVEAQKNPFFLAAYVAMFPQLIAGPIVRYSDIDRQLVNRKVDIMKISAGIRRFVFGLGKKILLSNALGEICTIFRNSGEENVGFYWLYAIAFTLQIYFDFSGYSDMAIGLGKMLGFEFGENFNYPYISRSITEFWRRWHISLGSWFRDYVYIPLGGNRVTTVKWLRNILIVWFLTGLWHGAAWNFILWGLMFAVLLLIEKYVLKTWLIKNGIFNKLFSHIYVILMVIIGFVIFNAVDMKQAGSDIIGMFSFGRIPLVGKEFLFYLKDYGLILLFAIIGATPIPSVIVKKLRENKKVLVLIEVLEPVLILGLMIIITAYLVDGSFNPFLYFRF